MTAKIIRLSDYKHKRILLNIRRDLNAMSQEIKYALVNGVCDICGQTPSGDLKRSGTNWICGGCHQ